MCLGAHHAGWSADGARRAPGRVVEPGLAPSGDLAPRVVGLAEVVAVVARRPGVAEPPRGVGDHHLLRPVRVGEVEVEPQARSRTPLGLFPAPVPRARRRVELPGAELRRQDVLTLPEQRRDVVRGVEHGLAVVGEAGIEDAVGRGRAVERELVVGQPRRVDACARHGFRDAEGLAQHRRRAQLAALTLVVLDPRRRKARAQPRGRPAELARCTDGLVVGLPRRFRQRSAAFRPGDPLPLPFARIEERRLEPRRGRPIARRSAFGPHAHAPEVTGARAQRRAGVDAPGIGRRDPPGVPDVRLALAAKLRRRRDQDSVGRLHHATPLAHQGPRHAWRPIVDAQGLWRGVRLEPRVRQVRQCCGRGRLGPPCERGDHEQARHRVANSHSRLLVAASRRAGAG